MDAGILWPAPLEVSRQKSGGLPPPVLDKVFRADAKKLPAVVGVPTPGGYALVRVTKVVDVQSVDEAKRKALAERLRQTVAVSELDSTLASLRGRIGVEVRKDAFEKKAN
jgi:peptidyl-prolyl cis-trans isomerase D